MENAIELYEGAGSALSLSRSPDAVLEEAGRAAKALKAVVVQTKAAIMLGTSEHLKCEAWQTLGHFYGLAGRITETQFVEFGDVRGFKAFSELVHVKSGIVISRAESMCLNDEDKWSARTKYEWQYVCKSGGLSAEDPGSGEIIWEDNPKKPGKKMPKKEKVPVGEERVPLFQLMSMAETRALSRVHSNVLKWVVVLAGYNPTPAEEVDDGDAPTPSPIQQPQRKSETQPTQTNGDVITKPQVSRLWAKGFSANPQRQSLEKPQIEAILKAFGYDHADKVKKSDYDKVIAAIESGKAPAPATDDGDPGPEHSQKV